jgi:hypothetical protein
MSVNLKTARGLYHLVSAATPEKVDANVVLPLALVRADGIERVVFRCRVESALMGDMTTSSIDAVIERIAPSIEREFETVREAALKSIRSEGKLLEIALSVA